MVCSKADQLTAVCPPSLPLSTSSKSFLESWMWNEDLSLANQSALKRSAFTTPFSTKDIHLRPLIASLNCGLWQPHLLAFLNLLRLPRPASPPKTRTDSRNAPNRQISQSSQILPITFSIWLQVRLLRISPQTPGSTHHEEPTMTYALQLFSFHVNMG